jgi:hypothetical protein
MTGKQSIALVLCALFFVTSVFGESKKRCISPAAAKKWVERNQQKHTTRVATVGAQTTQVGNILVLQADPELLILSNSFDLSNVTLRFHPVSKGRYAHTVELTNFDAEAAETVQLADDESYELVFSHFQFVFGRKTYDRCFINSNGNITFETMDPDPPAPDRVVQTIPRIAGFYADLNPENMGTIVTRQTPDKVVISWLRVPEFLNQNQLDYGQNTFQIVLYKTGVIDIVFTDEITATQGVVGLIPGFDNAPLRGVDFSSRKSVGRQFYSFVENFHDYISTDLPRLVKAIYAGRADKYDFISLFSNFDLIPVPGAQAFAINVRNNIKGIGNPSDGKSIFNDSEIYGSSGRLQNITFFGNIRDYPSNPFEELPQEDVSMVDILAHEVGHRWLSYVKLTRNGNESNVLLGRDNSHWSFFLDTEGSFLEGNQIHSDLGTFRTGRPFERYSDLDLYLIGLKKPEDVKDTYYVDAPTNFLPEFPFSAGSIPESGVEFKGNQIFVDMDDIIAANGTRKPGVGGSQKTFKHLFVLISKTDQPATAEEIAYLELVRASWSDFFYNATQGLASMDTVLEP